MQFVDNGSLVGQFEPRFRGQGVKISDGLQKKGNEPLELPFQNCKPFRNRSNRYREMKSRPEHDPK